MATDSDVQTRFFSIWPWPLTYNPSLARVKVDCRGEKSVVGRTVQSRECTQMKWTDIRMLPSSTYCIISRGSQHRLGSQSTELSTQEKVSPGHASGESNGFRHTHTLKWTLSLIWILIKFDETFFLKPHLLTLKYHMAYTNAPFMHYYMTIQLSKT